jgi:hypothetical protein
VTLIELVFRSLDTPEPAGRTLTASTTARIMCAGKAGGCPAWKIPSPENEGGLFSGYYRVASRDCNRYRERNLDS